MDFFPIGGPVRDETGEMHRRTNALIYGWGKYPWMINLYEWGAIATRRKPPRVWGRGDHDRDLDQKHPDQNLRYGSKYKIKRAEIAGHNGNKIGDWWPMQIGAFETVRMAKGFRESQGT